MARASPVASPTAPYLTAAAVASYLPPSPFFATTSTEYPCDDQPSDVDDYWDPEMPALIPQEDQPEAESAALHNLPHEAHAPHGARVPGDPSPPLSEQLLPRSSRTSTSLRLNEIHYLVDGVADLAICDEAYNPDKLSPASAGELLVGSQDGSDTGYALTAADMDWDDINLEDLPGVPSTFEDVVPIEPLHQDQMDAPPFPDDGALPGWGKSRASPFHNEVPCTFESIFDTVPVSPVTAPYSYMIANPGEVPQALQTPGEEDWYNEEGEMALEKGIRQLLGRAPHEYYLVFTSIQCLVVLRRRKVVSEQAFASLVYRSVDGNRFLWKIIKEYFIPKEFDTVPCGEGLVNPAAKALRDRAGLVVTIQANKTLARVSEALLVNRKSDCYLVYAGTDGQVVPDDVMQKGTLTLSPRFMGRCGEPWPFPDISVADANVLRLAEPLRFEDVFGGAEWLAREQATLEREAAERQGKKWWTCEGTWWVFPEEAARLFCGELYK